MQEGWCLCWCKNIEKKKYVALKQTIWFLFLVPCFREYSVVAAASSDNYADGGVCKLISVFLHIQVYD